jgi:hypothetical protein
MCTELTVMPRWRERLAAHIIALAAIVPVDEKETATYSDVNPGIHL